MSTLIIPDWPAPERVRSCSTTRHGGFSEGAYHSLNLGAHVGDDLATVEKNRRQLCSLAGLPAMPHWLNQVHGTQLVTLPGNANSVPDADAVTTTQTGQVCAVMTADCLPVIFCSADGLQVAAAHAGWRGLCNGVLENTLAGFRVPASEILAWMGPAIGPQAFEVGPEVRAAFLAQDSAATQAFTATADGKYLADLWSLARMRLHRAGVKQIFGGGLCTYSGSDDFFSYRRERVTGRLATLVWLL